MDKLKNKFYQFPHKVGTVSKYFVKKPTCSYFSALYILENRK